MSYVVLYYFLLWMQDRDRKLRIFPGSEHPFGDRPLEPYVMPPRRVRELRPRVRRAMIREQKKAEMQQSNKDMRKNRKKEVEAEVTAWRSVGALFALIGNTRFLYVTQTIRALSVTCWNGSLTYSLVLKFKLSNCMVFQITF